MRENESIKETVNAKPGLTPKQFRAIPAILESKTMTEAAKKTGVNRTSLYRWMEEPLFRMELERTQRAAFAGALARLQQASRAAVERLIESLDVESTVERRLAATEIIELCFKGQEIGEFSERLAELEERFSPRS